MVSAEAGRPTGMLAQALMQGRTRARSQSMRAYADEPLAVTVTRTNFSRLKEEINAPSRPSSRRGKLSKKPFASRQRFDLCSF